MLQKSDDVKLVSTTKLPNFTFGFHEDIFAQQLKTAIAHDGYYNRDFKAAAIIQDLRSLIKREDSEVIGIYRGDIPFSEPNNVEFRQRLHSFHNIIVMSREFQELKQETLPTIRLLRDEISERQELYSEVFYNITRLDLGKMNVEVALGHPAYPFGTYFSHVQKVGMRYLSRIHYPEYVVPHHSDHENWITLAHELLHSKELFGTENSVPHAIIQLAIDNEMRKRLTGAEYPPYVGHREDLKNIQFLHPDFSNYLNDRNINLIDFVYQLSLHS